MRTLGRMGLMAAAGLLTACQGTSDSASANGKRVAKGAPTGGDGPGILRFFAREQIAIPAGTTLALALETALSSETNKAGDLVVARLLEDVRVGDKVVVPADAKVQGHVTAAVQSGRVSGLARLAFDFDTLIIKGKELRISARPVDITAPDSHKRDAVIIGSGTGAGALIGAIADGKKGAGLGALIGAGAGTGVVLTTRGKEVELGAGARVTVTLTQDARL